MNPKTPVVRVLPFEMGVGTLLYHPKLPKKPDFEELEEEDLDDVEEHDVEEHVEEHVEKEHKPKKGK